MIVSKPKIGTLFSISIFISIAFGFFIYGLLNINQAESKVGWMILIYTSGPIGLVVLIKVLTGLRYIKVGKLKFEISFPFKFSKIRFESKDLQAWKHHVIKTYGGMYEEITWQLKTGQKYSVSKQENSEYDKILKYMKSKFRKLEA
ncbi:MAG: hypothetical protein JXR07_19515 [Reichenbachiella sp.]